VADWQSDESRDQRVSRSHAGEGQRIEPEWKDVLAMIIAAYQLFLPVLLVLVGAMLLAYLLFRFAFA
jgi:hypothetical protein